MSSPNFVQLQAEWAMTFSMPKDFATETCSSRGTNAQTLSTFESALTKVLPVLPPAPVTRIIGIFVTPFSCKLN